MNIKLPQPDTIREAALAVLNDALLPDLGDVSRVLSERVYHLSPDAPPEVRQYAMQVTMILTCEQLAVQLLRIVGDLGKPVPPNLDGLDVAVYEPGEPPPVLVLPPLQRVQRWKARAARARGLHPTCNEGEEMIDRSDQ